MLKSGVLVASFLCLGAVYASDASVELEAQRAHLQQMRSLRSSLYTRMDALVRNGDLTELDTMQDVLDKTLASIEKAEIKTEVLRQATKPIVSGSDYVGMNPSMNAWAEAHPDAFCNDSNGGTNMYMQGFVGLYSIISQKHMCPIFLFQEWILTTRTKYAFAAFFTWVVAILTEGLVGVRRYAQAKLQEYKASRNVSFACAAILYATHLTMGYLLMLVAMMYQTELFIILVFGLVCGHCIFNWKAPIADSVDPCCQSDLPMTTLKQPLVSHAEVDGLPDGSTKTILDVQGMTCMKNCGSTVERALMQIEGVKRAEVDIGTGKVTVVHLEKVSSAALVDAVDIVGFDCAISSQTKCTRTGSFSHSFDGNTNPMPPGIGSSLLE
jgi:copper chaperone CopZ